MGRNRSRLVRYRLIHIRSLGIRLGVKGRWDERKKLEGDIEVDKEVLNEESRGHYHDEIVREVEKLNGYLPEGCGVTLYVPHENFHRDIGAFGGKKCYTTGELFEGSTKSTQSTYAQFYQHQKTKKL